MITAVDCQRKRIVLLGDTVQNQYNRLKELWYESRALACHDFPVSIAGSGLVPREVNGQDGLFFWDLVTTHEQLRRSNSAIPASGLQDKDE